MDLRHWWRRTVPSGPGNSRLPWGDRSEDRHRLGAFGFSGLPASGVDRPCGARTTPESEGVPRPPLLQLEDPPELARLKRDRFRCGWLHTDTACRTRLNREAMSIARHEEPMTLTVAFGAETLSANR